MAKPAPSCRRQPPPPPRPAPTERTEAAALYLVLFGEIDRNKPSRNARRRSTVITHYSRINHAALNQGEREGVERRRCVLTTKHVATQRLHPTGQHRRHTRGHAFTCCSRPTDRNTIARRCRLRRARRTVRPNDRQRRGQGVRRNRSPSDMRQMSRIGCLPPMAQVAARQSEAHRCGCRTGLQQTQDRGPGHRQGQAPSTKGKGKGIGAYALAYGCPAEPRMACPWSDP